MNALRHALRSTSLVALVCGLLAGNGRAAPPRPVEICIPAASYWAETGVRVEKGQRFTVQSAKLCGVKDWFIDVHDLAGWPDPLPRIAASPLFWTRRRAFDPWFSIILTVDRRHARRLRPGQEYTALASGFLVGYFNDSPWAYGNNHGHVHLRLVLQPAVPKTKGAR